MILKDVKDLEIIKLFAKTCNWRGRKILDVGGGKGRLAPIIKYFNAVATVIDPNIKSLTVYNSRAPITAIPKKFEGSLFKDKEFQTVVCIDLLHYLNETDYEKLLPEFFRIAAHSVILSQHFLGIPGMKQTRLAKSLSVLRELAKSNGFTIKSVKRTSLLSSEAFVLLVRI